MTDNLADGLLSGLRRLLRPAEDAGTTPGFTAPATDGLALVYRGPAASPGCPESVAEVLGSLGLEVAFTGPKERLRLEPGTLGQAVLYAQPGGDDLDETWPHMSPYKKAIKSFVREGGVYIGFCLGGYLAGRGPGFKLLPGDTDQYIVTKGAQVRHDSDAIVDVEWRGCHRQLYFQDGPYFDVEDVPGLDVLARYGNGWPAALVVPYGAGVVGVSGPHPEATADWFTDAGLRPVRPGGEDLARDLIATALARRGQSS